MRCGQIDLLINGLIIYIEKYIIFYKNYRNHFAVEGLTWGILQ